MTDIQHENSRDLPKKELTIDEQIETLTNMIKLAEELHKKLLAAKRKPPINGSASDFS